MSEISSPPQPAFTVYFDGRCVLCAREIAFYRRRAGAERIHWVDLSAPGFDPTPTGRTLDELMRVFHLRDEKGNWVTGVDAFVELWKRLPGLGPLARMARLPGARPLLQLGYSAFVRLRPYLPRYPECRDGSCELKYPHASGTAS